MASNWRKIINDPVYGFITIDNAFILKIIAHPYYQRLRRISQMALSQLVYPGAVHTRLHHSLGAYHLMGQAVAELRGKGADITAEEETAVKAAILLHDIGHGPFSHALENKLVPGIDHEQAGLLIMNRMNEDFNGALTLAINLFTGNYPKPFLHQLISGQLDVDRMDYLTRDSFFSGVSEGVIGYDRILKMLIEHNGQLMVEGKGIYSVEKFLVARRQMYWQVYLHKTVLAAEKMLRKIIGRAREIFNNPDVSLKIQSPLDYFFETFTGEMGREALDQFCLLDDNDVMFAIKKWSRSGDKILALLCNCILQRRLFKCRLQAEPFVDDLVSQKRSIVAKKLGIAIEEARYFVFTGEATNTTYRLADEHINILYKDGTIKDISGVDDPLIHQTLSTPVKKFYLCELAFSD